MAGCRTTLVVLIVAVIATQTVVQGRELKQAAIDPTQPLACQVTFFDDSFAGGSATTAVAMPNGGLSGNSGCLQPERHGLLRSYESWLASCGNYITLYDDGSCGGTGEIHPARSGVITSTLKNSVDSFMLSV